MRYDALASGPTVYAYVGGNPMSRIDPLGLSPADVEKILQYAQAWTNEQTSLGWRIDPGWRNDVCVWEQLAGINDPRCGQHTLGGCGPQTDDLLKSLKAAVASGKLNLDDQWTFEKWTELSPLHYWIGATSSDPSDPNLPRDSWRNEFGPTNLYDPLPPYPGSH